MRRFLHLVFGLSFLCAPVLGVCQQTAILDPVRPVACSARPDCSGFDAIVFVHGIYGGDETFTNSETKFSWPKELPLSIRDRRLDVFTLRYQTELLAWAKGSNKSFEEVAKTIYAVMAPIRKRNYRSIGFVAHSLGGNLVSTYVHLVKTSRSHPGRSQHAYVITLATPVLGSQIAALGSPLKTALGMSDPLLDSLQQGNLFLTMLLEFRTAEGPKGELYGCRPVNLHAAYEEKYIGPLLVVDRASGKDSIAALTASPIVGFRLNHFAMAKPSDRSHEVYVWVGQRLEDEFARLELWDKAVSLQPKDRKLCTDIPFKPEP